MALNKFLVLICFLIILAAASFFRLWQLDKIPPGLYPDVALNGNEALQTLKPGGFNVFYFENNGREGLIMWLIAVSFILFGVSVWSIKIVAAFFGILTVLGIYLLAKELFKSLEPKVYGLRSEVVALLASFFLAVSFWHTLFSRIGFRAILLPFVSVFSFYFLFKGFRTKNLLSFIFAGLFFGAGFYTYTSFRMAVLPLGSILICWLIIYLKEKQFKKYLLFSVLSLLLIFIVALPIGIYFLHHPQDFISRATGVSIFNQENPIKALGTSLLTHLGMFNFRGDYNWRHNLSGSPGLPWPLGILFLFGFFFSIKELLNLRKHKEVSLVIGYFTLIIYFLAMLLPGILTYEGIPHSLRVIGVIPAVYIFVGLGGAKIYDLILRKTKQKNLLLILAFIFLLIMALSEGNKYFVKWGQNPEVKNAFSEDYVKIGDYLNSLSPKIQKYVIVNRPGVPVPWPDGLPMPAQTPMFIENTKYWKSGDLGSIYLLPEELDKIIIEKETMKEAIIVPMRYDEELFKKLQQLFPRGKSLQENGIWIYKINS